MTHEMSAINSATVKPNTAALLPGVKSTTGGNGEMGQDAFLKLLVAQLKYQNPLDPTDPAEFMAQSAQFTVVEKLSKMEKQNAEMLQDQRSSMGAAFIGKKITAMAADNSPITGRVTAVRFTADGPVLKIGNIEIPVARVQEVAS